MVIEQVLMRAMKVRGCLNLGCGMSTSTLAKWDRSMPVPFKIVNTIENVSGITNATSEQSSPLLVSLSIGILADDTVNCSNADELVHLKRRNTVKSLDSMSKSIKILHRMLCIVRNEKNSPNTRNTNLLLFLHLFIMSILCAKPLSHHYSPSRLLLSVGDIYFTELIDKDQQHIHLRRAAKALSNVIEVQEHIQMWSPQNHFLRIPVNKSRFISLLTCRLQVSGNQVLQAHVDADRLIVSIAVNMSKSGSNIVIVGEDTDLLVLMVVPALSGSDKLQHSSDVQRRVAILNDANSSAQQGDEAGMAFIVATYGGKTQDSIDTLHHHLYMRTVARQSLQANIDIATLPPTSSAARQHCLDDGYTNRVSIIGDEGEDMADALEEALVAADTYSDEGFAGPSPAERARQK
ncbi:hypothetical protein PR048_010975 [Dryococelus australis]|uniref:Uncharacterized protein n=1 Tax=Dryococelus australis TaxID=614101 RepID=A0ABQ9HKB0_9NEOP|nr:hypothetical protein PR048_010975 [Dryococelus australis]